MALYDDAAWTGKIKVMKKGDRLSFNDQTWVAWEDYQSLQAALREALERWTELHQDFVASTKVPNRVKQLRKQFLDI